MVVVPTKLGQMSTTYSWSRQCERKTCEEFGNLSTVSTLLFVKSVRDVRAKYVHAPCFLEGNFFISLKKLGQYGQLGQPVLGFVLRCPKF